MGLEETPEQYITSMVELFRECKRVLRDDGTLWVNIGDSYAGSGKGRNADGTHQEGGKQGTSRGTIEGKLKKTLIEDCKPKDRIGIPHMLAFALRADGWFWRDEIIWHKLNPMPESVTDRTTKAHEFIFMFSKSAKYYYDANAIKEESVYPENRPAGVVRNRLYNYDSKENNNPEAYRKSTPRGGFDSKTNHLDGKQAFKAFKDYRNKRSVWTVPTGSYPDAHFATYPEDLITDCIKAGCPVDGIVLDPFSGAGTTALVAAKLNRNYIGIELNPQYVAIAEKRLRKELGMFYQPQY